MKLYHKFHWNLLYDDPEKVSLSFRSRPFGAGAPLEGSLQMFIFKASSLSAGSLLYLPSFSGSLPYNVCIRILGMCKHDHFFKDSGFLRNSPSDLTITNPIHCHRCDHWWHWERIQKPGAKAFCRTISIWGKSRNRNWKISEPGKLERVRELVDLNQ